MPVTRSAREAVSRDTDAVNPKKKAGSWLREQRQKAGLSQMDLANRLGFRDYTLSFPKSKMAMVGSRLRAWQIGRGRLGSGLSGLLAFC